MATYRNKHGRKPGRGIRPWLLLPKVLAVGMYFGGQAAVMTLWYCPPRINIIRPSMTYAAFLFSLLVLPALLVTDSFGILLLLQHPKLLLRQRWLQVKLALLALVLPAMHLFFVARFNTMGDENRLLADRLRAAEQLDWGLPLLLLATMGIIILGRLKPSLGQNWAKTFRKAAKTSANDASTSTQGNHA